MKNFSEKLAGFLYNLKIAIKSNKQNVLLIAIGTAIVYFATSFIGFACFYGKYEITSSVALNVFELLGVVGALVLMLIGVMKKNKYLVSVPLIGLLGFFGAEFVRKLAAMFEPNGFAVFFYLYGALIYGALLAVLILYFLGYFCGKNKCKTAIVVILYFAFGLTIIEFILGCFAQLGLGYPCWEFSTLYIGVLAFIFIAIILLDPFFGSGDYILGSTYSPENKEDVVDAKAEEVEEADVEVVEPAPEEEKPVE